MRLVDGRRLTGRNLVTTGPAAAVELEHGASEDPARIVALLREEVARGFAAVEIEAAQLQVRAHRGGMTVAVPVEIDTLHTAVDALEWAVESVAARLGGAEGSVLEPMRTKLTAQLKKERNPALLALRDEAARRQVPFLWDDDDVSVGMGKYSLSWTSRALPPVSDVPWDSLRRIPVALVTGTNGKTTTTRFIARMFEAAGIVGGHCSTDGLVVGGQTVDAGDWSGPGGARKVLRNTQVEAAVLETARGGLLRRGLAWEGYDVGVITNIADDHLGEFGVQDLEAMTETKALVAQGVRSGGTVVLNADDVHLAKLGDRLAGSTVFFSARADNPSVARHVAAGGAAMTVEKGVLVCTRGSTRREVLRVEEIPLTFAGAAAYNVSNALAAAAAGVGLGLAWEAIAKGLRTLLPNRAHSPGRSNVLVKDGVRLLLDFAHNPAGVVAVLEFIAALRAKDRVRGRLIVVTGHAGDRSEADIREVARTVHAGGADVIIARDLPKYLRGRTLGEVPALFRDELTKLGMAQASIHEAVGDEAALAIALDEARPGDTIALLLHVDTDDVEALLRARGWASL